MPTAQRDFDLVLWGATGFTGRLVAECLLARHGVDGALRWALGGRDRRRLEALRGAIGAATGVDTAALPLVVADSTDPATLQAMTSTTRVVCSTVGPYARYGSELVAACARDGTAYCDLTGEVHWMRRMIDAHHATAARTGARIVFACGFDSIPADLGTWLVQREMQARHGTVAVRVGYRIVAIRGGASGGTLASMLDMLDAAERDPAVARVMRDPFALDPAGAPPGRPVPEPLLPFHDDALGQWAAPWLMAAIDSRVVRRTHALLGYPWGRDFAFDEGLLTGTGPAGWARAGLAAGAMAGAMGLFAIGPLRRSVARWLPQPGDGPSATQRESGRFEVLLHGQAADRLRAVRLRVRGDRDPGYGSTARMLAEGAACLALDPPQVAGGCWTPATALGEPLRARLVEHAGVTFDFEPA